MLSVVILLVFSLDGLCLFKFIDFVGFGLEDVKIKRENLEIWNDLSLLLLWLKVKEYIVFIEFEF